MKRYWQQWALKIDAMSLRERALMFAAAAAVLIMLLNTLVLDPQFVQQKELSQRIKQEQSQIAGMQADIQEKAKSQASDPDTPGRVRLQKLKQQSKQMHDAIQDMQKGLVAPDKMATLLEDILKHNGKLRLVSVKTLAVSNLTDPDPADGKAAPEKSSGTVAAPSNDKAGGKLVPDSVYKHGVEIVIQGGYLDIMAYMTELEAMPWQLFWSKAKMTVQEYPKATLTLTLFTLSLDKKWLNI